MSDSTNARTTNAEPDMHDLPPSAKLVVTTLEHEGELTQTELAERTRLSIRTVRNAVNRLEERDIVTARPSVRDARHRLYSLGVASAD